MLLGNGSTYHIIIIIVTLIISSNCTISQGTCPRRIITQQLHECTFQIKQTSPQEGRVPRMPTFSSTAPACSLGILAPNFPRPNLMERLCHNAMYFIVSKCKNDIEGSVHLPPFITVMRALQWRENNPYRARGIGGTGNANICAESRTQYAETRRTCSTWVKWRWWLLYD
jgi:hypothetical protein